MNGLLFNPRSIRNEIFIEKRFIFRNDVWWHRSTVSFKFISRISRSNSFDKNRTTLDRCSRFNWTLHFLSFLFLIIPNTFVFQLFIIEHCSIDRRQFNVARLLTLLSKIDFIFPDHWIFSSINQSIIDSFDKRIKQVLIDLDRRTTWTSQQKANILFNVRCRQ